MKKFLKEKWIYIGSFFLIVIDQMIKLVISMNLNNMSINVINNILKFTYCENRGVAFSLGNGNIPFFIILNIVIILIMIYYYEKNKKDANIIERIFYMLILAGGTSNLLDRIIRGFVIDFIDVNDLFRFAVFNVADIMIVIGVIGYGLCVLLKEIINNKITERK